ncbi:MAG: PEP-CTERM sorting domain-containing protein [Phycisphaerales bacterium]|nr:PEP-CTERM sorting domain-containing protein [Phycisphaerales bacterium]MCB9857735.1 PEP-CTERM sorting domain-containing protein [Phycisphaerales bacterium]MCB9863795.1 PEP-CTERM sorting domain-containing protein [Phycisphaerales bacterium]
MKHSWLMKATFASICIGFVFATTANAQNVGDSVMLMFQADNSNGFDTFPGARQYPVLDPTVQMTVGSVSGSFTALNAGDLQIIDSAGTGGFPFDDNFSSAGGTWTLNDPNFDVNDVPGEGLRVNFNFSSDAEFANLITSNILTDLIGESFSAGDFGDNPMFPIDNFLWEIRYNPGFVAPSELLAVSFTDISFSAGSLSNLVKITINGTVASNEITSPGSSLTIPEPTTLSLIACAGLISLRRRRRA